MIRIAASARRDLDEGYDFYESQEIGVHRRGIGKGGTPSL